MAKARFEWDPKKDRENQEKHGVGYVLGKPVDRKQIGDLVREAIQMKR